MYLKVQNQSKKYFLENIRILLEARENVLNSFKSNVFPTKNSKLDPTLSPSVFHTPKQTRAINILSITIYHFK